MSVDSLRTMGEGGGRVDDAFTAEVGSAGSTLPPNRKDARTEETVDRASLPDRERRSSSTMSSSSEPRADPMRESTREPPSVSSTVNGLSAKSSVSMPVSAKDSPSAAEPTDAAQEDNTMELDREWRRGGMPLNREDSDAITEREREGGGATLP